MIKPPWIPVDNTYGTAKPLIISRKNGAEIKKMSTSPQNTAVMQSNADILLESGTNELEVLVFGMGNQVYGVNVAKVREVILPVEVSASPDQPPAVMGVFNLRNRVLPLVDLHYYFQIEPHDTNPRNRRVIVTEFNGEHAAFQVENVEQIYRISWTEIRPVPQIHKGQQYAVTGITEIKDRLILMIDFESVFDHISMQDKLHIETVENTLGVDRGNCRVLLAEDSNFMRGIMEKVLTGSGYTQLTSFSNGADAWKALQESGTDEHPAFDVVVTDIEMPQMDGLALTRRIKSTSHLEHLPVLLFSSLITDATRHKGEQVGADEQITKPQLPELVQIVDRWIQERTAKAAA